MVWNDAALRLLDISADRADGVDLLAGSRSRLRRGLPAAVAEWFATGADRALARLSDNQIADLAAIGTPDSAGFLDSGLLLLETDSQHCCQWVIPLDGPDDPVVYLIDPDDVTGGSRTPYAGSFTAYTEATAWDALLYEADGAAWSFDHELGPDAVATLNRLLARRPSTFGWAHNQECDAVHRFDGPARVAIAVTGTTALWTVTATPDPVLHASIADILGIPADQRS